MRTAYYQSFFPNILTYPLSEYPPLKLRKPLPILMHKCNLSKSSSALVRRRNANSSTQNNRRLWEKQDGMVEKGPNGRHSAPPLPVESNATCSWKSKYTTTV